MDIICTIGPRTSDPEALAALRDAGMTIARLNGAHNLLAWHAEAVRNIKALGLPIYMDLPGSKPRPFQTYPDEQLIAFARDAGIDMLGFSNAEYPEQIERLRKASGLKVIAKIETEAGCQSIVSIGKQADGLLLDRTDFVANAGIEHLGYVMRSLPVAAISRDTPAWAASDILKSMISNPEPSAAEVSDILYLQELGFTGIVLAGETAVGRYPVQAVQTLSAILGARKAAAQMETFRFTVDLPRLP